MYTNIKGECTVPLKVASSNRKWNLVYAHNIPTEKPCSFSISQIKPYLSPARLSSTFFNDINIPLSPFKKSPILHLTQIILLTDQRSSSPEMAYANIEEIRKLMKRGTFKFFLKESISKFANLETGRFLLS